MFTIRTCSYGTTHALAVGTLLASLTLPGCEARGVNIPQSELVMFQPGVATCAQVEQRYGPPTSRSLTSNGPRRLVYIYQQNQVDPKALIPFYGRAYTMEQTQTVIDCDAQDRIIGYTSEQGQDKAGTGFGGGARQK